MTGTDARGEPGGPGGDAEPGGPGGDAEPGGPGGGPISISKNSDAARYEIAFDGELAGLAAFHQIGDVIVMSHTEIFPQYGGRGFAGLLIRFALDDIGAAGLRVRPDCSFVAQFMQRNPGYQQLRAR